MATVEPPVPALAEGLDTNLDVITYGHADWALSYVLPYYGGDCTRSGQIGHEKFTEMQITVGGAGTLTFWWRAYSESNDALSFYIDDVERCDPISGDEHIEWEQKSFNITGETNHTLRWRYAKNGWGVAGDDCGYVDWLQWTGGGPIPPPEPPEPPEPEWLTVSYTYDAAGRRIEKKVDGVVEVKYVYDGDHVIAEYDGSDNLLRKYVYGPSIDEPVCMINATEGYQGTYYYHYDALGSVVALTNSAANAVQLYEYSVYGQVSASDPNHPNRFMFTGREFDKDTGLYYYRARYYNPEIGRFLQTDPIGYGDGLNWYAYCGNSPLAHVDPSGCWAGFRSLWIQMGDSSEWRLQVQCLGADGRVGTDFYFTGWEDMSDYVEGIGIYSGNGPGDFCDVSFDYGAWRSWFDGAQGSGPPQAPQGERLPETAWEVLMVYVGEGWRELKAGAAATADGFIPLADPFEYVYVDESGHVATVYRRSQLAGNIARDVAAAAFGAGVTRAVVNANGLNYDALGIVAKYVTQKGMLETVVVNAIEFEYGVGVATMYSGLSTAGDAIWTLIQVVEYGKIIGDTK